jgi:pimeloyl-ACP methyl ester carboxylesterase
MWDPQMKPLLDAGYRVIRPEMRGYGHSSKQKPGQQFTHLDDMMTVMDSLHIVKAHVVGLSMGSFVASEMVAMYSDRLLAATLASGNIRNMPGPSTPFDSLELARKDSVIAQNLAQGIDKWKEEWIEKLVSGGGSNREAIRESVTQQVNDWDGWQLVNREMRNYYGYEAWDTLKARQPEIPVLILSGENEGKGKNPMLQYLPNSRQVIIPDCGHMSNMEKPEEFTKLILEQFKLAK